MSHNPNLMSNVNNMNNYLFSAVDKCVRRLVYIEHSDFIESRIFAALSPSSWALSDLVILEKPDAE